MSDRVRLSTWVALPPAEAFTVFTAEIDVWWRRGPIPGALRFENQRLVRVRATPIGEQLEPIGRILEWEPGQRLGFTWPLDSPRGESIESEVAITFEAEKDGCRVTLEHHGWESRAPINDGAGRQAYRAMVSLRWSEVLVELKAYCASRPEIG